MLENLDYRVYFTGAEFLFKGDRKRVKENEYMIAIKDNDKVKLNYWLISIYLIKFYKKG